MQALFQHQEWRKALYMLRHMGFRAVIHFVHSEYEKLRLVFDVLL